MKPWAERTREEAHLLNPAFCCLVVAAASAGYLESNQEPLPFALSFMVLPITLHRSTRETLPHTTRTSIPAWLQQHPEARLGFHDRLMALQPHTREAIRYGISFEWITVHRVGRIRCLASESSYRNALRLLDGDARDCLVRGRFLGKWLGGGASTATTMALWGVRP